MASSMYWGCREMDKWSFRLFLKRHEATKISFEYMGNVNNEFRPCGGYERQAAYEFYVWIEEAKTGKRSRTLIVYKHHRRTHEQVCNQLVTKYTRWAKQIGVDVTGECRRS